jgi:O-acetyl-ADP-ribose deacetylase (regulator of RNase III)
MLQAQIKDTILELVKGDITLEATDAIVNAANSTLLGGGGVDGAIHHAAGPKLLDETRQLGRCDVGDAKITKGYNLKARHVIHAVGPIYNPKKPEVAKQLASAYRRSLEIADKHALTTIAFPAISTGIYGYPREEAAPIALRAVIDYITDHDTPLKLVRFVLFDDDAFDKFAASLTQLMADDDRVALVKPPA